MEKHFKIRINTLQRIGIIKLDVISDYYFGDNTALLKIIQNILEFNYSEKKNINVKTEKTKETVKTVKDLYPDLIGAVHQYCFRDWKKFSEIVPVLYKADGHTLQYLYENVKREIKDLVLPIIFNGIEKLNMNNQFLRSLLYYYQCPNVYSLLHQKFSLLLNNEEELHNFEHSVVEYFKTVGNSESNPEWLAQNLTAFIYDLTIFHGLIVPNFFCYFMKKIINEAIPRYQTYFAHFKNMIAWLNCGEMAQDVAVLYSLKWDIMVKQAPRTLTFLIMGLTSKNRFMIDLIKEKIMKNPSIFIMEMAISDTMVSVHPMTEAHQEIVSEISPVVATFLIESNTLGKLLKIEAQCHRIFSVMYNSNDKTANALCDAICRGREYLFEKQYICNFFQRDARFPYLPLNSLTDQQILKIKAYKAGNLFLIEILKGQNFDCIRRIIKVLKTETNR